VEKKNDPNANDFSVKNNLSPPASRFSPRVENDLSLNQREEKERESGMWNGSHPPGRIIAGHCTYVHTYSRTHVTRVQGRHKWVGALTLARSRARARAVVTVVLVVHTPCAFNDPDDARRRVRIRASPTLDLAPHARDMARIGPGNGKYRIRYCPFDESLLRRSERINHPLCNVFEIGT